MKTLIKTLVKPKPERIASVFAFNGSSVAAPYNTKIVRVENQQLFPLQYNAEASTHSNSVRKNKVFRLYFYTKEGRVMALIIGGDRIQQIKPSGTLVEVFMSLMISKLVCLRTIASVIKSILSMYQGIRTQHLFNCGDVYKSLAGGIS